MWLVQYIYENLLLLQSYFHIVCISYYKSIKLVDDNLYKKMIDAKSKQNWKFSTRYTALDKRVRRYCNNSYHRIKDEFKIVTSQTERRVVSNNCYRSRNMTSIRLWYMTKRHMDAVSVSYRHRMFTENSRNKPVLKINDSIC